MLRTPEGEDFSKAVAREQVRLVQEIGGNPRAWVENACALFRSARAVIDRAPHEPGCLLQPALMLRGMGLECLLKARWVQLLRTRGRSVTVNAKGDIDFGGLSGAWNHDLLAMAGSCEIEVQHELEKETLRTLSAACRHLGASPFQDPRAISLSFVTRTASATAKPSGARTGRRSSRFSPVRSRR